jgi:hypothetical protein
LLVRNPIQRSFTNSIVRFLLKQDDKDDKNQ